MSEDDAILNSSVVHSEEEVLAEFQESCEAEAEKPGQHTERVNRAAEDLPDAEPQEPRSPGQEEMTAMPSVVEPMLPTLTKAPFSNPDWLFE